MIPDLGWNGSILIDLIDIQLGVESGVSPFKEGRTETYNYPWLSSIFLDLVPCSIYGYSTPIRAFSHFELQG